MSFLLILFIILTISLGATNGETSFVCQISVEDACCRPSCPYCGQCDNSEATNSTVKILYSAFYDDCCLEGILEKNMSCNVTAEPPCILDSRYFNDIERLIMFFKRSPLYKIILVSLAISFGVAYIIYSCCFFGRKEPPLHYSDIVGTLEDYQDLGTVEDYQDL